jgi:hypothetical protein
VRKTSSGMGMRSETPEHGRKLEELQLRPSNGEGARKVLEALHSGG